MRPLNPLRSLLFTPGNEQRKLDKAPTFDADAIVFDLEDAVPDHQKDIARQRVHATLSRGDAPTPLLVRITAVDGTSWRDDLNAAVTPYTAGIVVPKVEHPDQLTEVAVHIGELEHGQGLAHGSVCILALIETAVGIENADVIARTSNARLHRTILGTVDLAVDLGLPVGTHTAAIGYAAARLVITARAVGLPPPLDGPYTHLDDPNGYQADCQRSAATGMAGRVVLHPDQLSAAHAAYGPGDLDWHRRVVAAFEDAQRHGRASIRLDNQFIDHPVYIASRRALDQVDHA
jgi:citrate lyase subunit beta/citryl-CoA lyase